MGVVIIAKGLDLSAEGKNLGKVTINNPLSGISLKHERFGNVVVLTPLFTPSDTSDTGIEWQVNVGEGVTYSTTQNECVLVIGESASNVSVSVMAKSTVNPSLTDVYNDVLSYDPSASDVPVQSIEIQKGAQIGNEIKLSAVLTPSYATERDVLWSVESGPAFVMDDGTMVVYGNGMVTVKAESDYPGATGFGTLTMNVALVDEPIEFADPAAKQFCIDSGWDKNGDGNISYGEAMEVTTTTTSSADRSSIQYFNEYRYFNSLSDTQSGSREWAAEKAPNLKEITLPITFRGDNAFRENANIEVIRTANPSFVSGNNGKNPLPSNATILITFKCPNLKKVGLIQHPGHSSIPTGDYTFGLNTDRNFGCVNLEEVGGIINLNWNLLTTAPCAKLSAKSVYRLVRFAADCTSDPIYIQLHADALARYKASKYYERTEAIAASKGITVKS